MALTLFKQKDVVGIDIGSSSIKLVQLREAKGVYHLVNLGIDFLPPQAIVDNAVMDSAAVVDIIKGLVESHKIKTKNVATSISGHSVIIRKIQLPIMTEEELEASIQWEAEQYIPFEISEVNLDFQITGPDSNDPSVMNVILVAAKKDFVNDYVAVLKECGLNPVVMDVDCFAVENVFEANYGTGGDIVALINMGASAMNVNVLKGGASIFTRDIQVGGNMINEEIQKRLGLTGEDAERVKLGEELDGINPKAVAEIIAEASETLAQEVHRSLDFFTTTSADEKVHSVYITGGVAKIPEVRESLGRRMGISVQVMNPFHQVVASEKDFDPEYIRSVGPLFSVAAGLAMRRSGDK
jgi:type IV pilus assembly protein PilM